MSIDAAQCPTCSATADAIETATVHLEGAPTADVTLRCTCDTRWTLDALAISDATALARAIIATHARIGATHAALGLLLEIAGNVDDAYREYETALGCNDAFDRAFCLERRGVYEAAHGWLRNALHSLRRGKTEDRRASGARQAAFDASIEQLERELTTRGIRFAAADRDATDHKWQRELELELPPGFNGRNELGQPLSEDVIEVERLLRDERFDDAIAALSALGANDLIDAIGYASRGAERARATKRRDAAIALQELVVRAYVIWASGSSSGAEGIARTAEVERERKRLRDWQHEP